ncbi:MAG TPA: hypothetical protein P5217_09590 [Methanoregulaceae archaeon]|nr:hypothetical protein [Methanoregulaceae archaeon]HPD76719.1 hypothetical protein [Methanoregulaceae archaeon]HRY76521.1 hypothetical protein [Methanoregulaceae archaeon]
MMTPQAKVPRNHAEKKSPGKTTRSSTKKKKALYEVSEYSLAGFLDNEPDLYSVADLKVRYQ